MTVHGLCRTCGKIITYIEPGLDPTHHITCGPNLKAGPSIFSEPAGPFGRDLEMKQDLTEVIMWGWRGSDRSQQKMVGPSELGEPCARKLGYRIAGLPPVNEKVDPWPALVGTAIHTWLETNIHQFQETAGATRWLTEIEVYPDDLVVGHCDLYDLETRSIWDFKTMNSDKIKQFRQVAQGDPKNGIEAQDPEDWPDHFLGYRTQIHLYGRGMVRAGYQVDNVGLIALPRAGWLSNMVVWSEAYDGSIAKQALDRLYRIAEEVMELGLDEHPEQANAIQATPSRLCSFCDFYAPEPVSGTGCPGSDELKLRDVT